MLKKIGLVSIVAAMIAITGCHHDKAAGPANDATAAPTAVVNASTVATPTVAKGAPTGGTCGTIAGTQCSASGDFCKKPTGQCAVVDAAGTCTKKPQICTKIFKPVCGCNGHTYGNACEADMAGVSVQAEGACAAK